MGGTSGRRAIAWIASLGILGATALVPPAVRAAQPRPNIVLILTDDQRWDQLTRMPHVHELLMKHGVTFHDAFILNPLCCPSRATILTGLDSSHDGIWNNSPPHGGFETFTGSGGDQATLATWLQSAGYRTALVGKYLNGYYPGNVSYIPPGWDRWHALALKNTRNGEQQGGFYDYAMSNDGRYVFHGSARSDYSTDVLAGLATAFITNAKREEPLFLYFAPRAPHAPATAADRDKNTCGGIEPNRPPSYDERNVSDKPPYVRELPHWDAATTRNWDEFHVKQCKSLHAVDDAVASIVHALSATGRLSDTLIVFLSDNGLADGEHRWDRKTVPYEESIRTPLVVRFDRLTGGTASATSRLVTNLDIAPTFLDAAGISEPTQGTSLLPLVDGSASGWRTGFLLEHGGNVATVPAYCGIRSNRFTYVRYSDGFEELYDLTHDPYELHNLLHEPQPSPHTQDVRTRLLAETQARCDPPPPGYSF